MRSLSLRILRGAYAVVRLPPNAEIPPWAMTGALFSVTRTLHELSIVCEEHLIGEDARAHGGWRAMEVIGPFGFDETGVLASLAGPLAHVEIPIFVVSTYDTDLLFVRGDDLSRAAAVLRGIGHVVTDAT